MIASMTGFGRAILEAPFGKIVIEIQSLNRKYLDISVSLPKEYGRFEAEIRKWISEKITRGQISVRVHVLASLGAAKAFIPSLACLKSYKEGWEEVAEQLGYAKEEISLPFLASQIPGSATLELAKEEDVTFFETCTKEALQGLLSMKQTEGRALKADMEQRLLTMEEHLALIETLVPDAVSRMKNKMQERIAEVAPTLEETDERVLREIAIFAEKVDIAEEVTRFRSHVVQFRQFLKKAEATGRKMDFLVQEMGREINTVGSKSLEAKIAHLVVEVKSELEKVREQIQNIE